VFAVLHIADFALHAVLRTEPGLGARPAALFNGTGKKSLAIAVNAAARTAGVDLGMTAPQAVARCASLLIRAPRPAAEAEARAALLAVGFTLSPSIEDTAPGVCTIDLRNRTHESLAASSPPESHDFGYIAAAVEALVRGGLPATVGIAATPLLALYAARAAEKNHSPAAQSSERTIKSKIKRTRTSASLPATVLHVTDTLSFLAPLPLSAADPSPSLAEVLFHWGVHTLGDLTVLPRDEIVRRFGAEGLALWQRASGGSLRPLHLVTPAQTFAAEMEFEHEIETLEPLLFVLRRFLDRLTLELITAQQVAAELHFSFCCEDDTTHARNFRLPEPTAEVEILFRTLHTHLESVQTAAAISAVQLRVIPARPLVRQQGLFETGLRDPHGFAETLARVSALVGADRVGTPQLEVTHRPDAVKLVPPLAVIPPAAEPPVHAPSGLPLRRFRPPLPARLEFTDGRATYLWTEHVRGEISTQRGPWHRSGDWWQSDRAWQRTEWDLELTEGGLYRLLLVGEAWFVEGEYD
jgi:protein ImuB